MARNAQVNDSSSGVLLGAVAGAVLGATALAWWLLSEAERRQQRRRQRRGLELSRLQNGSEEPVVLGRQPVLDHELQNKVQKLNRAIEDVRRQLESLTPKA